MSAKFIAIWLNKVIFVNIGVYKPRVRCYETSQFSMKFERCLDSEGKVIQLNYIVTPPLHVEL